MESMGIVDFNVAAGEHRFVIQPRIEASRVFKKFTLNMDGALLERYRGVAVILSFVSPESERA